MEPHERPPKSIWRNGEKLSAWFDNVNRDRKRKFGGGDAIEDPVQNELAAEMLRASG